MLHMHHHSMNPISPSFAAVITVEVWITMPRSVACPPSQRNATTARASRTWWLSVPTRRWCPPQALRTNMRLPRPPAQGPGPTSAPQRRRSALARPLWKAPPPPPRSPTHIVSPGPRGGGNPETVCRGEPFTPNPWPYCLPSIMATWSPTTPHAHIYLTPVKKKMGGLIFSSLIFVFKPAQLWQRSTGYGRAWMCVTDWLTCSLVQLWQPPLE